MSQVKRFNGTKCNAEQLSSISDRLYLCLKDNGKYYGLADDDGRIVSIDNSDIVNGLINYVKRKTKTSVTIKTGSQIFTQGNEIKCDLESTEVSAADSKATGTTTPITFDCYGKFTITATLAPSYTCTLSYTLNGGESITVEGLSFVVNDPKPGDVYVFNAAYEYTPPIPPVNDSNNDDTNDPSNDEPNVSDEPVV